MIDRKRNNRFTTLVLLALFSIGLAGCPEKDPIEKAGDAIEDAVDDAGDAIEDAGDAIEDALD